MVGWPSGKKNRTGGGRSGFDTRSNILQFFPQWK